VSSGLISGAQRTPSRAELHWEHQRHNRELPDRL